LQLIGYAIRTTENHFQNLTREEILKLDDELFLSAEDAMSLIEFCELEDLAVVGIEGGEYDGNAFTLDLDLIQDYSELTAPDWPRFSQNCNKRSRIFLAPFIGDQKRSFYLVVLSEKQLEKPLKY
jgi:hypothetical protein